MLWNLNDVIIQDKKNQRSKINLPEKNDVQNNPNAINFKLLCTEEIRFYLLNDDWPTREDIEWKKRGFEKTYKGIQQPLKLPSIFTSIQKCIFFHLHNPICFKVEKSFF